MSFHTILYHYTSNILLFLYLYSIPYNVTCISKDSSFHPSFIIRDSNSSRSKSNNIFQIRNKFETILQQISLLATITNREEESNVSNNSSMAISTGMVDNSSCILLLQNDILNTCMYTSIAVLHIDTPSIAIPTTNDILSDRLKQAHNQALSQGGLMNPVNQPQVETEEDGIGGTTQKDSDGSAVTSTRNHTTPLSEQEENKEGMITEDVIPVGGVTNEVNATTTCNITEESKVDTTDSEEVNVTVASEEEREMERNEDNTATAAVNSDTQTNISKAEEIEHKQHQDSSNILTSNTSQEKDTQTQAGIRKKGRKRKRRSSSKQKVAPTLKATHANTSFVHKDSANIQTDTETNNLLYPSIQIKTVNKKVRKRRKASKRDEGTNNETIATNKPTTPVIRKKRTKKSANILNTNSSNTNATTAGIKAVLPPATTNTASNTTQPSTKTTPANPMKHKTNNVGKLKLPVLTKYNHTHKLKRKKRVRIQRPNNATATTTKRISNPYDSSRNNTNDTITALPLVEKKKIDKTAIPNVSVTTAMKNIPFSKNNTKLNTTKTTITNNNVTTAIKSIPKPDNSTRLNTNNVSKSAVTSPITPTTTLKKTQSVQQPLPIIKNAATTLPLNDNSTTSNSTISPPLTTTPTNKTISKTTYKKKSDIIEKKQPSIPITKKQHTNTIQTKDPKNRIQHSNPPFISKIQPTKSKNTIQQNEIKHPLPTKIKPAFVTRIKHTPVKTKALTLATLTWNLAENTIHYSSKKSKVSTLWNKLNPNQTNDFLFISTQETENPKPRRKEGHRSKSLRQYIMKQAGRNYIPLCVHSIGGIQAFLFVHKRTWRNVQHVNVADVPCGIGNVYPNKGAIGIFLHLKNGGRVLLVSAHLAAHVKNVDGRCDDFWRIMSLLQTQAPPRFLPPLSTSKEEEYDMDSSTTKRINRNRASDSGKELDQLIHPSSQDKNDNNGMHLLNSMDYIFFAGDLNYRINLPREIVHSSIQQLSQPQLSPQTVTPKTPNPKQQHILKQLLLYDQLHQTISSSKAFPNFKESAITFLPTFKYDISSDAYDTSSKQRIPAWTDRIVFSCKKENFVNVLEYDSIQDIRDSDHRPVYGIFEFGYDNDDDDDDDDRHKKKGKKKNVRKRKKRKMRKMDKEEDE